MTASQEEREAMHSASGFCFSCERFMGTRLTCPYCGEKGKATARLRLIRSILWIVAIIGLWVFWLLQEGPMRKHRFIGGWPDCTYETEQGTGGGT